MDNDTEGIEQMKKAQKYFGEVEAQKFLILPNMSSKRKTKLENIYDALEVINYKAAMGLPKNQSFEKAVIHLFYSEERANIIAKFFPITQQNFGAIIKTLEIAIQK